MGVGVLMPAFNEASKIGMVVAAMPQEIEGHAVSLLVVDDGSDDGTTAEARLLGATVVTLPVNRGKGYALRSGMTYLDHLGLEAIVWMDADGQHSPGSLPILVAPVLSGQADMVVGSRYVTASATHAPWNRRMVRRATIRTITRITGHRLTDPFSGFRCFSPSAVEALEIAGDGYGCELEAFFSVARAGLRIVEVPIPRIYGPNTSKMGYHSGRLRGRAQVVGCYARTVLNASRMEYPNTVSERV